MGMFRGKGPAEAADQTVPTSPDAGGTASERMLEQRLREAVVEGRFRLHYQPLISLVDGQVAGLEALLRWESDAGRVSPATFIPVLEATGLVHEVGPWVIAEACRQVRPWLEAHPTVFLTVNISPQQLRPGFAASVLQILEERRFDAHRLVLELIRPAVIADPTAAWGEMRRLKASGVRLFVDDFGAIGSSLADLRRFSLDAVKIDSTLVAGLGRSSEDEAIVAGVVTLAHALGMRTVAEGVETEAQLQALKALGCDLAQGYHLVEPSLLGSLAALLDDQPVSVSHEVSV